MSDANIPSTQDTQDTPTAELTDTKSLPDVPSRYAVENLMALYPKLDYLMAETILWAHKNNMLPE